MFLYKNLFFSISSILSIPIMLIGINGGYFPAICRVCFLQFDDTKKWCNVTSVTEVHFEKMWSANLVLTFSKVFSMRTTYLCNGCRLCYINTSETLHQIFRLLGKSFSLLSQFESEEVIKTLQSLPLAHFETGFVLECIGRAHCEKSEYKLAIEVSKLIRISYVLL